jgi:hypothetical protein
VDVGTYWPTAAVALKNKKTHGVLSVFPMA